MDTNKSINLSTRSILILILFLVILSVIIVFNNREKHQIAQHIDTGLVPRIVDTNNSHNIAKHKDRDEREEAKADDLLKQHAKELINKYIANKATLTEVLGALEAVEDLTAQHSLWPYFVDHAKLEDYEMIVTHLVSKTNTSVASSAIHNLTLNAARADGKVDLKKVCELIPEGRLRAVALTSILSSGSKYFMNWVSLLVETEHNLGGEHLGVTVIDTDHGLHSCNNSQLIQLYNAFSGPGKSTVSYILRTRAAQEDISTVNGFMINNHYPTNLVSEVLNVKLSKYSKDKLLTYNENSLPDQASGQFIAAVASRIDTLANQGASLDWLTTQISYNKGRIAFDERIKFGLGLSSETVAKKIVAITDDRYRNRGYYLLAEFLSRPEEKELRSQWINAITDEALKAEAIKKFGNR
jgi:hypothetical protein